MTIYTQETAIHRPATPAATEEMPANGGVLDGNNQ